MRPPFPGADPVSDLIYFGRHPFPEPVERLILQIHQVNPHAWREFAGVAEGWTRLSSAEEERWGRVVDFLLHTLRDLDEHRGH